MPQQQHEAHALPVEPIADCKPSLMSKDSTYGMQTDLDRVSCTCIPAIANFPSNSSSRCKISPDSAMTPRCSIWLGRGFFRRLGVRIYLNWHLKSY